LIGSLQAIPPTVSTTRARKFPFGNFVFASIHFFSGQAYVYIYTTIDNAGWTLTQTIPKTQSSATDFGASVALSINGYMDLAVVGAPGSGNTYVYYYDSFNTWTQQAILTSTSSTQFGQEVVVQNNTILVGASAYENDKGSVVVYNARETTFAPTAVPTTAPPSTSPTLAPTKASTWTVENSFTEADGSYGQSCSISPANTTTYAVIGMPGGGTSGTGEIYVYSSTDYGKTWSQLAAASGSSTAGTFGRAVSNIYDTIVVGAPTTGEYHINSRRLQ
jgi:hypothetical protein